MADNTSKTKQLKLETVTTAANISIQYSYTTND